ncbi:MAG: FAD-binding domain-containing protein [Granulosicoccus sp.]
MNTPTFEHFLCDADQIQERITQIDPRAYDKTRNYLDGDVTWLSPFLTHGIIDTRQIADIVLGEHKPKSCYRLLFELGWREFFHRTWQLAGDDIFTDMRQPQTEVHSHDLPEVLVNASTGIEVIDKSLNTLTQRGVMHNHARMWVAGLTCNMAATYWHEPARWLHYHLLDGDLASNTLSWQWIAGTFSHKKYVANQSNIDKYSRSKQSQSWLDIPYEEFDPFTPPSHLKPRAVATYAQEVPGTPIPELDGEVALRSLWQLDPSWQSSIDRHIVFIDTDLANHWPMSPLRWQFVEHWANACNATIYHGTVQQLRTATAQASLVRSEYPACSEWPGQVVERNWLYPMPDKSFNSFSQYFKQVKRHAGL